MYAIEIAYIFKTEHAPVTPKFKDKFEYNNLMCVPGIVAHTSRQITNVSSQVSYITILQHKYIKVCDKRKIITHN